MSSNRTKRSKSRGYFFHRADDTRTSYYLTHEESETARLKGMYYDLDNEVIFIKTLNRSWSKAKEEMESNPLYRKMTEFFWHEYEDP